MRKYTTDYKVYFWYLARNVHKLGDFCRNFDNIDGPTKNQVE